MAAQLDAVQLAVKTCQSYHTIRLPAITSTWAPLVPHLDFVSEVRITQLPAITSTWAPLVPHLDLVSEVRIIQLPTITSTWAPLVPHLDFVSEVKLKKVNHIGSELFDFVEKFRYCLLIAFILGGGGEELQVPIFIFF